MSADVEIVVGAKDQASAVLGKVGGNVSALSSGLKAFTPIGVGAAAVFGQIAAAIAVFDKASAVILERAKSIDELAKAARRVGESVGDLQAFQFALGEIAGVASDTAQQAIAELRKGIGEALGGSEGKKTALEQLGLDADSLSKAGTVEAFGRVRDALSKIENGAQRAAIAEQLLGGEARKLMGLLSDQSDAFSQSMAAAERLGLTISDAGASGVESMNDALGRANATLEGLATQATVSLAPAIELVADRIIEIGQTLQYINFDDWVDGATVLSGMTYDVLNNTAQIVDALRFIQSMGGQGDLSLDFSMGTGQALLDELMEKRKRNEQAALDKALERIKAQRESAELAKQETGEEEKKLTAAELTIGALEKQLAILAMGREEYEKQQQLASATTDEERRRIELLQERIGKLAEIDEQVKQAQQREQAAGTAQSGINAVEGRLITRGNAGTEQQKMVRAQEASLAELRSIRTYMEEQVRRETVTLELVGGNA